MRFFKDFVNEVDENGGKHLFDHTCNVRKQISISNKNKKEYFELYRDHKQVIRLYPNEKQRVLQQLQMLFFHGKYIYQSFIK